MLHPRSVLFTLVLVLSLVLPGAPSVALAAPINDNLDSATVISGLPFSDTVDISQATTEFPFEPTNCGVTQTVWYAITPSVDEQLKVDMSGSAVVGTAVAYRQNGAGFGGLAFLNCSAPGSPLTFSAHGGATYLIQAGSSFFGASSLHLTVSIVPPPPNDNFANATAITSIPFNDTADSTSATFEAQEPTPTGSNCGGFNSQRTVWYAFTPTKTQSVTATSPFGQVGVVLAAYTGVSLNTLSQVGCGFQTLTFGANAGTTYYLQAGGPGNFGGQFAFSLNQTPPPVAGFSVSVTDPTVFDTIQFFNSSFDPANVGFKSMDWSFGDGTTATGCCPTHRYTVDGDYTAKLAVTTLDGRTASASQVLHVRTHDVAITKVNVPQSASAGQTRHITVGINNQRGPETVQVQLLKGVAGSFSNFQVVGTLTQLVPTQNSNGTTPFDFSYTFTPDDASNGKVTFEATATIIGPRDAQPADNTVIALPTKVSP